MSEGNVWKISWLMVIGFPCAILGIILSFFSGRTNLYISFGLWLVTLVTIWREPSRSEFGGEKIFNKGLGLIFCSACLLAVILQIYMLK